MSAFEPVPGDEEENMKKAVPENKLTSDSPAEGTAEDCLRLLLTYFTI